MFHPHLLDLFFGKPHNMTDTFQLISALKVEQELQQKQREERERERREVERYTKQGGVKFEL